MDVLYHEMYAALEPSHKEGFQKNAKRFLRRRFYWLTSYGALSIHQVRFRPSSAFRNKFVKRIRVRTGREIGKPCVEHEKLVEEVKAL